MTIFLYRLTLLLPGQHIICSLMKYKTYYDRWGKAHISNPQSTFRKRAGAFVILHTKNAILFNFADYAPDVPDLPGGGIDAGETAFQAAIRELSEEAELIAPPDLTIDRTFQQNVHFYAEHEGECWDYDQTFFLVRQGIEPLYFEGVRTVAEGRCAWIGLNHLKDHTIHYMHGLCLKKLGFV